MAYYTTIMLCSELVEKGRIDGNYDGKLPTNNISVAHQRYYEQALDSICPDAKRAMEEYMAIDIERKQAEFKRTMDALKNMQDN